MSASIALISVGDARSNKIGMMSGVTRRQRGRPQQCRRFSATKCSQDGAAESNGNSAPPVAAATETTLHKLIEREGGLIVPGVYDSLSAL